MNGARRWLMVATLLYVAFDLCDPLLPGAFSFDPDNSVEVVHHRASHSKAAPTLRTPVPVARAARFDADAPRSVTRTTRPTTWDHGILRFSLRSAPPEPASSTDDH